MPILMVDFEMKNFGTQMTQNWYVPRGFAAANTALKVVKQRNESWLIYSACINVYFLFLGLFIAAIFLAARGAYFCTMKTSHVEGPV